MCTSGQQNYRTSMRTDSTIHIWPIDEAKEQEASIVEKGSTWRVVQESWPQLTLQNPPPKPYKIVIDMNMLLADMRHKYLYPEKPVLLESLQKDGMIEIWAPHWLISELRCGTGMTDFLKGFPSLNHSNLWSQWPALQEIIKIDRRFDYPLRREMFGVTDIKDEPYVAVARAQNALGVLSRDAGFQALKLNHLVRRDLRAIEILSQTFEKAIGAKLVTIGAPTGAIVGVGTGLHLAYKKALTLPKEVQCGLALVSLGVSLLWIHPKSREFVKDRGRKTGAALKPIWDGYLEIAKEGLEADKRIEELVFEIENGRT